MRKSAITYSLTKCKGFPHTEGKRHACCWDPFQVPLGVLPIKLMIPMMPSCINGHSITVDFIRKVLRTWVEPLRFADNGTTLRMARWPDGQKCLFSLSGRGLHGGPRGPPRKMTSSLWVPLETSARRFAARIQIPYGPGVSALSVGNVGIFQARIFRSLLRFGVDSRAEP